MTSNERQSTNTSIAPVKYTICVNIATAVVRQWSVAVFASGPLQRSAALIVQLILLVQSASPTNPFHCIVSIGSRYSSQHQSTNQSQSFHSSTSGASLQPYITILLVPYQPNRKQPLLCCITAIASVSDNGLLARLKI